MDIILRSPWCDGAGCTWDHCIWTLREDLEGWLTNKLWHTIICLCGNRVVVGRVRVAMTEALIHRTCGKETEGQWQELQLHRNRTMSRDLARTRNAVGRSHTVKSTKKVDTCCAIANFLVLTGAGGNNLQYKIGTSRVGAKIDQAAHSSKHISHDEHTSFKVARSHSEKWLAQATGPVRGIENAAVECWCLFLGTRMAHKLQLTLSTDTSIIARYNSNLDSLFVRQRVSSS